VPLNRATLVADAKDHVSVCSSPSPTAVRILLDLRLIGGLFVISFVFDWSCAEREVMENNSIERNDGWSTSWIRRHVACT
jgi:hypothetical protein